MKQRDNEKQPYAAGWHCARNADTQASQMGPSFSGAKKERPAIARPHQGIGYGSSSRNSQTFTPVPITPYRSFGSVHLLVDYSIDLAICIAYGDRDGGKEVGRNGARSAVKSGGFCAAKTTPPYKTFAKRVLQPPLRPVK